MKNLFIGLMLLTASFSFANSTVEVKPIKKSVTTTIKAKIKSNKVTEDKTVCYCHGGNCGCGVTMGDAMEAYNLASH